MRRSLIVLTLFIVNASGIFPAQKGADPTQRYFRLICLVHLTGSGKAGDPVVPEYVAQGTAVAVAGAQAPITAGPTMNPTTPGAAARAADVAGGPAQSMAATAPTMSSRPGYLAWSMQISDDGTMAIIQIVAADHHAFDSILADTRPEIRVFEIGKDTPAAIQTEMQKHKQDFNLNNFRVIVR